MLQESPTPVKTSTKRTRISDRGRESESSVGKGAPVQQAKGKAKAKQVEENTLAKKTCARQEPETTVEVAKEVQKVDLGVLDIDEDTLLDLALVLGVEKMVRSLLSCMAAQY